LKSRAVQIPPKNITQIPIDEALSTTADSIGFLAINQLIVYWNSKPLIIMAKFDLKFLCCHGSGDTIKVEYLKQVDSEFNEHWISIQIEQEGKMVPIALDKSTAIKFAKTLRTEINKINTV